MSEEPKPFLVSLWCVFGWRKDEDSPELLDAWDDYAVEQNWDGWTAAASKAAEANDIDPRTIRTARVLIDWNKVEALYHEAELEGEVEPITAA